MDDERKPVWLYDDQEQPTGTLSLLPGEWDGMRKWRIILEVEAPPPNVIGLDVKGPSTIGRATAEMQHQPDLNLAAYDAEHHGVSRWHAALMPMDNMLCLVDLGSTNGTWVNGVFLQPGQRHSISKGDRFEFGTLALVVRVVGARFGIEEGEGTTNVVRPKP